MGRSGIRITLAPPARPEIEAIPDTRRDDPSLRRSAHGWWLFSRGVEPVDGSVAIITAVSNPKV